MRQKKYLAYLVLQLSVIAAVIFIFRIIEVRQVAAVFAGALFVLTPIVLLISEYRSSGFQEKVWYFGVLQFWVLFAVPIFCLRIVYWDKPFSEILLLGLSGDQLHVWSSKSYMVMMLITVRSWFLSGRPKT